MLERQQYVLRDRLGVKPLYWTKTSKGVLFASELKALLCEPSVPREIDPSAVASHVMYLWAPSPLTMLRGIHKLPPGHAFVARDGEIEKLWRWYDLPYAQPLADWSDAEAIEAVRAQLLESVRKQLVADVPVGAFLSGGLDSSSVVAMARRAAPDTRMRCFTIGFDESEQQPEGMNEDLGYARLVAKHLDVDLEVITVRSGMIDQLEIGRTGSSSADYVHLSVEATKRAFAVRDHCLTDPAYMTVDPQALLAPKKIRELAQNVDRARAARSGGGRGPGDTLWMGVVDGAGRAVSMIQSLYHEFGSGVVLEESGINWQNRGCSFALDPAALNSLRPGRKPFHTLNPALAVLRDGRVLVCDFGVARPPSRASGEAVSAAATPFETVSLESGGVALVLGSGQEALEAATELAGTLDITVLLKPGAEVIPPRQTVFPVLQGRARNATGYLGAFEVTVDDYASPAPSSRGVLRFEDARNGAVSRCDLIIDLTGDAALFPAADLRPGYFRADPGNPIEVARLIARAGQMVGTFDKPKYINFAADICARALKAPLLQDELAAFGGAVGARACRRPFGPRLRPGAVFDEYVGGGLRHGGGGFRLGNLLGEHVGSRLREPGGGFRFRQLFAVDVGRRHRLVDDLVGGRQFLARLVERQVGHLRILSGGLGGAADHALFSTLRALADVVLVAAGTVRAEGYGPARLPLAVVTRSC